MHTSPQHQRITFLVMSQHDDLSCRAFGCCEPRQDICAEFCLNHERQIHAFELWLDGAEERCWPAARSFDFERNFWSGPQRPV
jgi:hypothetical protein